MGAPQIAPGASSGHPTGYNNSHHMYGPGIHGMHVGLHVGVPPAAGPNSVAVAAAPTNIQQVMAPGRHKHDRSSDQISLIDRSQKDAWHSRHMYRGETRLVVCVICAGLSKFAQDIWDSSGCTRPLCALSIFGKVYLA